MMRSLYSLNYDGFISLEWNPEWMPDIANLELISLHFVNTMSRFGSPARMVKSKRSTRASAARALPVAEGQAYRQDLPAGARPHSRGIPRPVRLQIHNAELHAHILRVPRRRGRVRARAHFTRRQARQPRGYLGDEPSAVVPDLLGDDENRRGASDGQHRLQNPRGRVPAAPVRHAHTRHDQGLPRFALRRDYEGALPRA